MFKLKDKIMVGALIVMFLTFPASNRYVLVAMEVAYQQVNLFGGWVFALAGLVLSVCMGITIWNGREKVSVPKKSQPTKAQKYIVT